MKFAYFVLPHLGGTYSVFKSLRSGLGDYGIEVRWLGLCEAQFHLPIAMRQEERFGSLLTMPADFDERACARRMAEEIEAGGYDGVFINVLADRLQTNIARYLPESILRIVIVHNITPGTYAAARSIRDYAHATIGVSERCRFDLVEHYGFPAGRTYAIENALDVKAFVAGRAERASAIRVVAGHADAGHAQHGRADAARPLRCLFAGRIEDASKGVLWLREILDALPETVTLTVVGTGPDLPRLKRRLAGHSKRVEYLGAMPPERIPSIMARHDVLIMPSRYEGLPMTLIEAMAGGCVPVVSHIRGVSDTVVDDGETGFLFPVGNYRMAAQAVARLNGDRNLLARMSAAAGETVSERYDIRWMADRYHQVIRSLVADPPRLAPLLDIDNWAMPSGLRPGLRTYVPLPLKNWLRVVRERL